MNMINLYIQEVTRRLPEKNREDIALELRSTIEDMLPDHYGEQELKSVLATLGDPGKLASNYLDKPGYLIGPNFYGVYLNLLKMILPIAALIAFSTVIANQIIAYDGEGALLNVILDIFGMSIWQIINTFIQVFFWLTVVFAVIERVNPTGMSSAMTGKEWAPDDLKSIPYIVHERKISAFEVFAGFLWTAIWGTVFFSASRLIGVYEKSSDGLVFVTPTFNQDVLQSYWPFVVFLIGMEVVLSVWKYITKYWTIKLAIFNSIYYVASSIIFIVIVTTPNLITASYMEYMTDLLSLDDGWGTWVLWGAIFIFIISVGIDAINGFRKAKMVQSVND